MKQGIRQIAALALLFLLAGFGLAEARTPDIESAMERANAAYKDRQYDAARESYESLKADYPDVWELHYNLGNVYHKLEKTGLAIAHYRKALKLNPREKDILENLRYVESTLKYKIEDKRNWYWVQWLRFVTLFALNELLLGTLAVYALWILLVLLKLALRREGKTFRVLRSLALTVVIVLALPLATQYWVSSVYHDAVVIVPEAEVRYGPTERDQTAFRLTEGLTAQVRKEREDWVLVNVASGETGWCKKKNLKII